MLQYIYRFLILFYQSIWLFLFQYLSALVIIALQHSLKSGSLMPPVLFSILRITLAVWILWGCILILGYFFYFSENVIEVVIGIILTVDSFEQYGYLTVLILIREDKISFHYFVSSSVSFIKVLQFLVYRSFISLAKIILSILFFLILLPVVFFSFSDILLLVHRNTAYFYIPILYTSVTEFLDQF